MRAAAETDFTIPLPEVGDFIFARRTMGDMIKIRSTYLKLIDGSEDDDQMVLLCGFTAAYQALIVDAPSGWEDISAIDMNAVGFDKVQELATLLLEKESSFRRFAKG